ncbi:Unknown protein, partial [Striga hermonthica]
HWIKRYNIYQKLSIHLFIKGIMEILTIKLWGQCQLTLSTPNNLMPRGLDTSHHPLTLSLSYTQTTRMQHISNTHLHTMQSCTASRRMSAHLQPCRCHLSQPPQFLSLVASVAGDRSCRDAERHRDTVIFLPFLPPSATDRNFNLSA